jgi:alpha-glucosidase
LSAIKLIRRGEELGLPEVVDLPESARADPAYFRTKSTDKPEIGRDGCRVPIPWTTQGPTFGFSPSNASRRPHLPIPEWFGTYAAEAGGVKGTLELYKKALRLRKEIKGYEEIEWLDSPQGVISFRRGNWVVLINIDAEEAVHVPQGEVMITSADLENGNVPIDTTVWLEAT